MPLYEYRCKKCGHEFEEVQGIRDNPVKKCPKCRGKVERQIPEGTSVQFKCQGFYETDYNNRKFRS